MTRARRVVGLATLLTLLTIALGVSGAELPFPRGGSADGRALPGVQVASSEVFVRVGAGAPPGGELAFLTVESSGNLLVADRGRRTLMRFDPSGHLLTEWGPRLGDERLDEPAGVAVTGDSIYLLDRGTPRLFRLGLDGALLGVTNLASLGPYGLNGLAAGSDGNVYAADTGRNRILEFAPDGALVRQLGRAGADLGAFTQPMHLAFAPDGSVFVADWENARIERFDAGFNATDAWPTGSRPFSVAVDQLGRVFAPNVDRSLVEAFTPTGAPLGQLGGPGSPPFEVAPRQIALARSDPPLLYLMDAEGIDRLALASAPPPLPAGADVDVTSLAVLVLLGVVLFGVFVRRRRRRLLAATPDGPVRLDAENGAQRQHEQPRADQELLVAHQTEREQQAAHEHNQAKQNAEAHQS